MVAVGARSEGREFDPRSGDSLTGVDTDCVPVLAGVRENYYIRLFRTTLEVFFSRSKQYIQT